MIRDILIIILFAGIMLILLQFKIDYDNDLTEAIGPELSDKDIINGEIGLSDVKSDFNILSHDYTVRAEPGYVSDIFRDMFMRPTPWLNSMQNYDRRKQEIVSDYFTYLP